MPDIIKSGRNCTGCFACFSICPVSAIEMRLKRGFYMPEIDKGKCISCNLCVTICPQNKEIEKNEFKAKAYACKNKDEDVRRNNSTSGGIFSLLAEKILSENGVVYGAAYDDKCTIRHIKADELRNLDFIRRTKYGQSFVGNSFQMVKDDLKLGKKVLFSGTPCQCSGLVSYLGRRDINLLIVEVLCHGVPSPLIWDNYVKYLMKVLNMREYPDYINLRSKQCHPSAGWNTPYSCISSGNKKYCINNRKDAFIYFFTGDVILNKECYQCRYRKLDNKGYTDFSLADFWGIRNIINDFDDDKGCSLVLCHSDKAEKYLKSIKSHVILRQVDAYKALSLNGAYYQPLAFKADRIINKKLYNKNCNFMFAYYIWMPVVILKKIVKKLKRLRIKD